MALPVYPNAISLGLVNTELGYASSIQSITLNDAAVRSLFVKASGAIAMSDGHGKSAVVSAPVIGLITTSGTCGIGGNVNNPTFMSSVSPTGPRQVEATVDIWMSGTSPGPWTGIGIIEHHWHGTPTSIVWEYHPGIVYWDPPHPACSVRTVSSFSIFDNVAQSGTVQPSQCTSIYAPPYPNSTYTIATNLVIYASTQNGKPTGMWRVIGTNSAGYDTSKWYHVRYYWDIQEYSCNCQCDCDEDCDENNENCTGNCSGCCDTCYSPNNSADNPGLVNCG